MPYMDDDSELFVISTIVLYIEATTIAAFVLSRHFDTPKSIRAPFEYAIVGCLSILDVKKLR